MKILAKARTEGAEGNKGITDFSVFCGDLCGYPSK